MLALHISVRIADSQDRDDLKEAMGEKNWSAPAAAVPRDASSVCL